MQNPWSELDIRRETNLIHPDDRSHVEAFNKIYGKSRNYKIPSHTPPLPYLGNPEAPIVVLLANPGLTDLEAKISHHYSKEVLEENYRNLLHLPSYDDQGNQRTALFSKLQSKWWNSRVRKLIEATSLDRVENGLFFANFHPYHSRSWKPILFTMPTQHYTFHLVRKAIQREAVILMSRNTEGWVTAIPELYDYQNRFTFLSTRSVFISPGNLKPKVFNKIKNLI